MEPRPFRVVFLRSRPYARRRVQFDRYTWTDRDRLKLQSINSDHRALELSASFEQSPFVGLVHGADQFGDDVGDDKPARQSLAFIFGTLAVKKVLRRARLDRRIAGGLTFCSAREQAFRQQRRVPRIVSRGAKKSDLGGRRPVTGSHNISCGTCAVPVSGA
jgi:hypothetical protein